MAGEPKTGHLVHGKNAGYSVSRWETPTTGRMLHYEPFPSTCHNTLDSNPSNTCWHALGFRFQAYQWNYYSTWTSYFPNRTFTRQAGQTLYFLYDPAQPNGTWYACALMLNSSGYWNCYMYVGPNATLSRLRQATEVTSWQAGNGRIWNTGGLPVSWQYVVIRSVSPTLYGPYSVNGVIAYHSYCSLDNYGSRWNGVNRVS